MLSFAVYRNGQPADRVNLTGAYVIGSDDVPLRADITFRDGVITCKKRAAGPGGLALLGDVQGVGSILLETIRVQERDRPYILQIELARGRMLRLLNKLEDWGLLDQTDELEFGEGLQRARDALIKALQAAEPAEAAALGEEALQLAVSVSNDLAVRLAGLQLQRRRQAGGLGRRIFGCTVPLEAPLDPIRKHLTKACDFVTLPLIWREVEPAEQTFNWKNLDAWVEALAKQQIPIRGSALLSFEDQNVPDWLYIWEHDFDTIRDLAFEHARRLINRYGQYIQSWVVVSGIHANNCFSFNFEQLMELTRMTSALARQLCPRGTIIIDMVQPWGEYYARNQRTIPPGLYADMTLQSGINFDAYGVQFHFGAPQDGYLLRDMFQLSAMLDQFSKIGKPAHVTAVEVPSGSAKAADAASADGGVWREPWTEDLQAEWLERFIELALSKPFIESVSWSTLTDQAGRSLPRGGLLRGDLSPKAAFDRLARARNELQGKPKPAGELRA